MKKNYTIASDQGAERYGGEVGDTVALELDADEELAVVAAGWIDPTPVKKETK